jgi:hypothetical protein
LAVYNSTSRNFRAVIRADNALLLAGLRRTAALVEVGETHDESGADFGLHVGETGLCHPLIDLKCDGNCVVLTVAAQPSSELWSKIRELIAILTPSGTKSGPSISGHAADVSDFPHFCQRD